MLERKVVVAGASMRVFVKEAGIPLLLGAIAAVAGVVTGVVSYTTADHGRGWEDPRAPLAIAGGAVAVLGAFVVALDAPQIRLLDGAT